jgi:hypothetical protein
MTNEGDIFVPVVVEKCDEIAGQVLNVVVGDYGRMG